VVFTDAPYIGFFETAVDATARTKNKQFKPAVCETDAT
jgi:hypothetical protein